MKKHLFSRMVVVGAVVILMGVGIKAFAADNTPIPGNFSANVAHPNLTDDQAQKMQAERNAFQTATKDIRQQIHEKRSALNTELSKPTPDAATATALQKSLSDLQAQFDQKHLAHILVMKNIDPNFTEGPGMRRGMGHGMQQPNKGSNPFGNAFGGAKPAN